MYPLSAERLLDIWEEGRAAGPVDRALLLLMGACPDEDAEALAALSVGERDHRLLRVREWAFGPRISSVGQCPECGEAAEMDFSLGEVAPRTGPGEVEGILDVEGIRVRFRPPDSRDLAELSLHLERVAAGAADSAAATPDGAPGGGASPVPSTGTVPEAEARRFLLERCVVSAHREPGGPSLAAHQLPESMQAAVVEALEAADPMGDLEVAVTCPGCSHAWDAALDVPGFLWQEVDRWARRTLLEVHALASAYAWPETEILRLSPTRRRLYLELVGA